MVYKGGEVGVMKVSCLVYYGIEGSVGSTPNSGILVCCLLSGMCSQNTFPVQ